MFFEYSFSKHPNPYKTCTLDFPLIRWGSQSIELSPSLWFLLVFVSSLLQRSIFWSIFQILFRKLSPSSFKHQLLLSHLLCYLFKFLTDAETFGSLCFQMLQVIEIQLPSFFNNFDPRAAAANFPSSNIRLSQWCRVTTAEVLLGEYDYWQLYWRFMCWISRRTSIFGRADIRPCCFPLQYTGSSNFAWLCGYFQGAYTSLAYFCLLLPLLLLFHGSVPNFGLYKSLDNLLPLLYDFPRDHSGMQ